MPSLDDILKDMLVVIANGEKLDGLNENDPKSFEPTMPSPTISGPMNQSIWYWEKKPRGANPNDPGYLGEVFRLNCWARWMAESHKDDRLGWMTVCHSVRWSPVKVDVKRGNAMYRLTLPLTEKFVVKTFSFTGGHNPGKGWWPLEADVDASFFQVFVYDITGKTSNDEPEPVPKDTWSHDGFMPDPSKPKMKAPTLSPGEQVDLTATNKHYVCVVMSLACCTERADFEPGALVGMARAYPHYMIMTNLPLDEVQATIRIQRPDQSGYYGTSVEQPRPPMQHPDMDPPLKAVAIADTNQFRAGDATHLVSLPFWDLIFDYGIDAPDGDLIKPGSPEKVVKHEPAQRTEKNAIGLLDYDTIAKAARGAIEGGLAGGTAGGVAGVILGTIFPPLLPMIASYLGLIGAGTGAGGGAVGGSIAFTRPGIRLVHRSSSNFVSANLLKDIYGSGLKKATLLPRKKADVLKWARQGSFDSIHIAPRMKAHLLIGRSDLNSADYATTLGEITMAPFCEHDCFHTHWRWGANWADLRATPVVKNRTPLAGFGPSVGKFAGVGAPCVEIGAPLVPMNQELEISFEAANVFNYIAKTNNDIIPGVWQAVYHHGFGYAVSIVEKAKVEALIAVLTGDVFEGVSPQFSEFYWTLRYQDTIDGPLPRIDADRATLARLMGL